MSDFDWVSFFDQRGVRYEYGGPNAGRNDVAIKCPFCGSADKSEHMAINLEGRGWVCRRNREHSGKSPIRLIRALVGCSADEARRIAGVAPAISGASLADRVRSMVAEPVEARPVEALPEPSDFRELSDKPSARPFMAYLAARGFSRDFLLHRAARLGIRYAVRGPFGGRVIFLVHDDGRLVTWTGRALSARQKIRYKELPEDPGSAAEIGLPPAAVPLHSCLMWQDDLARTRARVLCLVEGPMDALKMRMLGGDSVLPAAIFTNSLSAAQVDRLRGIVGRFEHRIILLDRGAEGRAMRARRELAALGMSIRWLPDGVDDPGELTARSFAELALDSAPELRL